jgi:hypothetical protein
VCGEYLRTDRRAKGRKRGYQCLEGHVRRDGDNLDDYIAAVVIERLSRPDAAELMQVTGEDTSDLYVEAQTIRERLDELARLYGEGSITAAQLTEATATLMDREATVEARLSAAADRNALAKFGRRDPASVWQALDIEQRRAVIDVLMTVRVGIAAKGRPRGWSPGQPYFDADSIIIEWKP